VKSVAVIQARTNSSRLPGKVLLPVKGMPLVVLAARRAANTGRQVIVATSLETTDDFLAETLQIHGISSYRGSLDNTLERFVTALEDYNDETPVFRLTADNVLPDGALLDEIEQYFIEHHLDYLCCNGEKSGLPYGMSVELTRLRHLRDAAASTTCKYDQEHVTPYIRRKFGEYYFEKYRELSNGHFRCTVDCLDDYLAIQQLFSDIDDPIQVSAFTLVEQLGSCSYQPWQRIPARKLVLGTAQLGMQYGIANLSGKPDQSMAEQLIKSAIANGAAFIDTARAYGNSEEVIGTALRSGWEGRSRVVTKLSPLTHCPVDANQEVIDAFVDASIYASCSSLRMQRLDVLMLHRASHMTDWNGAVWKRLLQHKAKATFNALGVSVQSPAELELALASPEVGFIQMPFNVLDWRWDQMIPKIIAQKQQRDVVIHVRSALLQGLLPSKSCEYWQKANAAQPENIMEWLAEQTQNNGKTSIADFCLSFVKSFSWVDGLVIGMETLDQLAENVKILCGDDFSQQEIASILATRPKLEENSLNPSCWR